MVFYPNKLNLLLNEQTIKLIWTYFIFKYTYVLLHARHIKAYYRKRQPTASIQYVNFGMQTIEYVIWAMHGAHPHGLTEEFHDKRRSSPYLHQIGPTIQMSIGRQIKAAQPQLHLTGAPMSQLSHCPTDASIGNKKY